VQTNTKLKEKQSLLMQKKSCELKASLVQTTTTIEPIKNVSNKLEIYNKKYTANKTANKMR